MNPPLVAVFMVTYNHENYIEQAIVSVLMQKTTFPIKLFIGEDCSTDQTAAICLKFKQENPDIIEVRLNKQNIGATNNAKQIFEACFSSDAKYIAMLEGDDYWTDPYKLQKQVDFLEANKEYSLCFHNSIILNENGNTISKSLQINGLGKSTFYTEDLITQWFIPTSSIVFVTEYFDLPDWFCNVQSGDIALILLLSLKGPARYLDEVMSIYRRHPNGISNTHTGYFKFISMCYLYQTFNIYSNFKFNEKIYEEIKYEFETHVLTLEREKIAKVELNKIIEDLGYLNSKISFKKTIKLLLCKTKLNIIYMKFKNSNKYLKSLFK